jgi:hypothetical protein
MTVVENSSFCLVGVVGVAKLANAEPKRAPRSLRTLSRVAL